MMKKVQIEQNNLKLYLWEKFCSKDYPPAGLDAQTFAKIIFQKAKKTYQRYVRLYYGIGRFNNVGTEQQLLFSEKSFCGLSLDLLTFKELCKRDLKKLKIEKKVDDFIETVELFGLCVLDDWIHFSKVQLQFFQHTKPAA